MWKESKTLSTLTLTLPQSHEGACGRSLTSRQPDSFQFWTLVFNYNARCGDTSPATPVHAVQV